MTLNDVMEVTEVIEEVKTGISLNWGGGNRKMIINQVVNLIAFSSDEEVCCIYTKTS